MCEMRGQPKDISGGIVSLPVMKCNGVSSAQLDMLWRYESGQHEQDAHDEEQIMQCERAECFVSVVTRFLQHLTVVAIVLVVLQRLLRLSRSDWLRKARRGCHFSFRLSSKRALSLPFAHTVVLLIASKCCIYVYRSERGAHAALVSGGRTWQQTDFRK